MNTRIIIFGIVMFILMIAYIVSVIKHWRAKKFRIKLIQTIILALFLVVHIVNVALIGRGLFPLFILDIILFILLVWNVICLIRLAKDSNKDSHFVKIDGRTYIVRNIYSKD